MVFSVIGWTIIHSLWQCLALLAGLKLFLGFVDVRRSRLRYAAALGVLGLAVLGVLWTLAWEWRVFAPGAFASGSFAGGDPAIAPVTGGVFVVSGVRGVGALAFLGKVCPYLTMGWALGVAFFCGRLMLSGVELRRLRRSAGFPDAAAEAMLEGLRVRMGVLRPVRLLITERIAEPMTFGFLRAVVVLPLSYVSQVPAEQLEMILAHEVAHIRRRDYVINLVQSVFDALLFYNPFFRMISEAVREEREYCCDDLAAQAAGGERKMAVALTSLGLVRKGLALGLSVVPARRSFYRRVMRLIEPEKRPVLSVRGGIFGFLGAAAVVVLLTQCSRSTAVQDKIPVVGDRLEQVLTDNQAGYKEQVFNYTKGGKEHELFLVRTQNEKQALYAYVDGKRLSQDALPAVVNVVKAQRPTWSRDAVIVDGSKREISAKPHGTMIRDDVREAKATYAKDTPMISLGVDQHRILTRIITSNQYTETDQREVSGLVRRWQAARNREHDAVLVEGRP